MTSLSRAMTWFAASYAGAILGYLGINAAAGRWLGPTEFGFFVTALTITGLLGQVGLVGVHRSGLREVAQMRDEVHPEAMAVLRNGVRAVNLTTLPLAGVVGGVGTWLFLDGEPAETRLSLAASITLLVILTGQQKVWANFLRGLGYVRFASVLEGRSGGALVAGLQALLLFVGWKTLPSWGIAGALFAVAIGYAAPVALARRIVASRWRHFTEPQPRLVHDLRHAVRRDWRFLSGQVAAHLNLSIEIWISALLLSSVDTSMYTSGQRIALLLVLPLTALQIVFAPVIARMAGTADAKDLQTLLRTGASLATIATTLIALPILVAPDRVLTVVFGLGFHEAVPVLVLLAFAFFGNVATGMAGTALSMLQREGIAAKVQWIGVVLRVLIGFPAAWAGGLMGLTISAVAVSVLVFLTMWISARRVLGVFTHATLRPQLGVLRRTPG